MKTRSTTIVAVRREGVTAIAGDGQITVGDTVFKNTTVKLRRMREGKVITGYAGAAADALALYERLEAKLDEYSGNVQRAAVELVKDSLLLISGTGDVSVPDDDVIGIGAGGPYAQAAALAMLKHTEMPAPEIAREAVRIASQICIYTNDNITVEVLQ